MDAETWNDNFGELNLHGKIVGNSCIDWSHDHQIAIGTNKKVVVCDMSMFIGGSKMEEIGYMIENVPVITEKQEEGSPMPSFLSDFETASTQPSNTKAFPDYDVYKVRKQSAPFITTCYLFFIFSIFLIQLCIMKN